MDFTRSLSRRNWIQGAMGVAGMLARPLDGSSGIKIGMIPDAGATQVSIDEKAPLKDYLAKATGTPVDLIIPTNYNATVEALGNGSLDFAYLGALTYVKAHQRYGVLPLVQRAADKNFHSLFITQSGSAILKVADCKGKRFAFGDINSTSGHLIPHQELMKAGVNPDHDLQFRFTGSHSATAKAVEGGASDAGALDETVFHSMVMEGKVDGSKVRVFHTSPAFVDYVWVARKDIGGAQRESFAQAFLSLKEGKDDAILNILRGKDFVRADDAEYANIRKIAAELKML
ncbi:MAG TPA: phosphate/phosphite/phosphonate ABC transporter substrate-binding protein [Bryobacteraceae bacterium]|nr:phosphate/phosphite/phosphonate ABC transporter substrate-binding protein [Bryobacteraceae bacterium]